MTLLGYGHVGSVLQGFVCRSGVLARRVKHFGLWFEAMPPRKLSDPKAEPKRKRSWKGAEEAGSWSLECLSVLQGGTESVLLIDLEAEVETSVLCRRTCCSSCEWWGGMGWGSSCDVLLFGGEMLLFHFCRHYLLLRWPLAQRC